METKAKKREWVKNVAIIFLTILLILTFFSNTIMNASLPEVATKTIMSGSIVSKIRVTGTVVANQNYEVSIDQSREVASVLVKVDQEVSAGDVLFTLGDSQSSELESAEETLRQLNLSYQRALINAADADYVRENRDIQLAKEALAKAESERDELYVSANDISILKENIAAYKDEVAFLEDKVKRAQEEYNEASGTLGGTVVGDGSSNSSNTSVKNDALAAKREELTAAEAELETAWLIYGDRYDYIKQLAVQAIQADGKSDTDKNLEIYMPFIVERIVDGLIIIDPNPAQNQYTGNYYMPSDYKPTQYSEAYTAIITAQSRITTIKEEISAIKEQNKNSSILDEYSEDLKEAQSDLAEAQEILADAEAELAELESNKTKYDAAVDVVESCEKNLEDLIFSLEEQQKNDNKTAQLESLDLQDLASQIAKQKEEIEKLTTEAVGKEVVAKVSGIVRNIYITAGNTTTPGSAMAVIEIPDMGYGLSASVTNEQARKVHTGDTATVSNYYWGSQVDATLTAIKPDPQNPQSNKILEFELTGDVTVGSNLTLSVGARNAEYDYVVPNSAIKSDSNGSFILVVTAESSPLGNKYTATRVDVTVLASDDTSTAISGGLNSGDFVITTSTKPISNGDRVKMPDEL